MSSSEEEEEEEEGDAFNADAFGGGGLLARGMSDDGKQSPNRSLASMRGTQSEVGTSSTIQDRITRTPSHLRRSLRTRWHEKHVLSFTPSECAHAAC